MNVELAIHRAHVVPPAVELDDRADHTVLRTAGRRTPSRSTRSSGAPRRGPPAAAPARRAAGARRASSSPTRGRVIGCAELAPLSTASPRSARSSCPRRPRGRHRPPLVAELLRIARLEDSTSCARSRTSRATSSAWASPSCRTRGCRRRSRWTASAARCSATAASRRWCSRCRQQRRSRRAATLATARSGRGPDAHWRVAGGVTAPAGFRAAGLHCGIKASGKPDLALVAADAAGGRRGPVHARTRRRRRRCSCRSRTSNAAAAGPGGRHQQRLRQRLHRPAGPRRRRSRWPRLHRGRSSAAVPEEVLVASTGVIGVNLKMDAVRGGHPEGGGGARRRRRRGRRRRHHDDRSVSEVGRRRGAVCRRQLPRRRHGEGLGHDRAAHGDDARLPDDRCRRRRRHCCSVRSSMRAATPSTRSRWTASRRPTTACSRWPAAPAASPSTRRSYPALFEGLRAVALELSLGIVRGGEGATKLVAGHGDRRGDRGRRVDRGARHRQFAAGEDRGPRRRSELGPPGRGSRPLGRRLRARAGARPHRRRWCSSTTASRSTSSRRRRPSTCRARTSTSRWTSAPAARTRHRLDLRPVDGLRPDQRRVPARDGP